MNNGKKMEQAFRKNALKVDNLFYYRFRDAPSSFGKTENVRFTPTNMCDCMIFRTPNLYLLELKSHKGSSLPFSAIRENQLLSLSLACNYNNIISGFIVDFADKDECYFVRASLLRLFVEHADRKSIPIDWFRDNGIKIHTRHLKVNKDYDVKEFVEYIEGTGQWN